MRPLLWALLAAAFVLRLWGIGAQSIWYDEAFTIHHSQQSFLHASGLEDNIPPLHAVLLHLWMKAAGTSPLAARFPSILASTAAVAMTFIVGRRLVGGRAALVAALFAALSAGHIHYAQEARTYALFYLLVLVSMHAYLRLLDRPDWRSRAYYIGSGVLLVYSHIFGFLVLLCQTGDYLWRRKPWKPWLAHQAAIVAAFAPWLLSLPGLLADPTYDWILEPNPLKLVKLLVIFAAGDYRSVFGVVLALLLFALAAFGVRRLGPATARLLLMWLLLPALSAFAFSLLIQPLFVPRYLLFSSFPLLLLAGRGAELLRGAFRILAVAAVVGLGVFTIAMQQSDFTRDPWDRAVSDLGARAQPGEPVYVFKPWELLPFLYYAHPDCFAQPAFAECAGGRGVVGVASVEELSNVRGPRVWAVLSHTGRADEIEGLLTRQGYDLSSASYFVKGRASLLAPLRTPHPVNWKDNSHNTIVIVEATRRSQS